MFGQNNGSKVNQEINILLDILTKLEALNVSIVNNGSNDASLAEQQIQTIELNSILAELTAGLNTANSPSHIRVVAPSNYTITGFKEVSFVCSSSVVVTVDGNAITYPEILGTTPILGSTIKADTISTNSIVFNGAGTVLITIYK